MAKEQQPVMQLRRLVPNAALIAAAVLVVGCAGSRSASALPASVGPNAVFEGRHRLRQQLGRDHLRVAARRLLSHYEQSQRNADVKVMMHEFVSDVPSIVSFLRVDLFAYNRDLKNYRPNNLTPFDNMMDVDI